jgi:hypothetical protein
MKGYGEDLQVLKEDLQMTEAVIQRSEHESREAHEKYQSVLQVRNAREKRLQEYAERKLQSVANDGRIS